MKWLVYLHYRLDTGECFYIGKGTEKRSRAKDGRNEYWNRIFKKAGRKIVVAQRFEYEQDALSLEVDLIARYTPVANLSIGGENGFSGLLHSDEAKSKCRASTLALRQNSEWLANNLLKMKEAVSTPEVREKMSQRRKEYFANSANRLNMSLKQIAFRKNNPEVDAERQRKSKEARSTIEYSIKAALAQGAKPFAVYENGTMISECLVIAECARQLNLHSAAIHKCLKGKQSEHKGYTFKYKEAA